MFAVVNLGAVPRRPARRLGQTFPMLAWEAMPDPDSMPPEKAEPSTVTPAAADTARKEYVSSAKRFDATQSDVTTLRASTWQETARRAANQSFNEYKYLVENVRGRTGNPDAEYELEAKWFSLWKMSWDLFWHPPSWWDTVADQVGQFLSDFLSGAQAAWQDYTSWTLEHAGPALEDYYNSVNDLVDLRQNLQEARASGKYPKEQLDAQEAKIVQAESARDSVRTAYSVLSVGGSIDQVAQAKFGAFKSLGWPAWVGIAVGVVVVAGVIALFTSSVHTVNKIGTSVSEVADAAAEWVKKNPGIFVGGLFALTALIAVPLVLVGMQGGKPAAPEESS